MKKTHIPKDAFRKVKPKRKLTRAQAIKRLARIKLLLLDVDGVLTDGTVFYVPGTGWTRTFNVKDGYGIRMLVKRGFQVGVISGGASQDLKERMTFLGVQHFYYGDENKIVAYEKILRETGFKDEEVVYLADELFDLPVLRRVGFSATVPAAVKQVQAEVDYVTELEGGWGAAREIIDAIIEAQPALTGE